MVTLLDQPVYLLAGTEQFLKEETLAKIKSTFLDKESCDFNFNVFYAGTHAGEKILECARTTPFLGRKRLVLVYQVEDFSTSDKELILSYVRTPHRHTLLLLETQQTNLRQNFFNEICQYARVILCMPFKDNQLFGWIKTQAKAKGKTIEEKAQAVLVNNLGNNLKLLSNSLDNLILYIGEKKTIRAGDVERLVGRDLTTTAFELFDAIAIRNKSKALQVLDSLFKEGINSAQILGALAHKIISERTKINPSLFERFLQNLQRADSDIKTGRQSQRIALELLMVRLLQL